MSEGVGAMLAARPGHLVAGGGVDLDTARQTLQYHVPRLLLHSWLELGPSWANGGGNPEAEEAQLATSAAVVAAPLPHGWAYTALLGGVGLSAGRAPHSPSTSA